MSELAVDAELLLLLDELLARGSLFAKTLIAPVPRGSLSCHHLAVVARVTAPAASLIAPCHDIHSVLLNRSKPFGGKLSSHFSHSWGEYLWNNHMVHDNVFEEYLSKMLTCTKKITGGRRGNSREGERKFRQPHPERCSLFRNQKTECHKQNITLSQTKCSCELGHHIRQELPTLASFLFACYLLPWILNTVIHWSVDRVGRVVSVASIEPRRVG